MTHGALAFRPHSLAAATLASVLALACSRGESRGASTAQTYEVRGEVMRLADPRHPDDGVQVRHEPLPDFKDASGATVGMSAMVMPFQIPPKVIPPGLEVGDKLRLRFTIDWKRGTFHVVEAERLPPRTVLDFGTAAAAP